jgi:hypothetical protein
MRSSPGLNPSSRRIIMKSPSFPRFLTAFALLAVGFSLSSGRLRSGSADEWRDAIDSGKALESAQEQLKALGVDPDPSIGKIDAEVGSKARQELIDIEGVKVRSGDVRKPEAGGEEAGDEIDIEDPCPGMITPIMALSQLPQLPRRPLGETSRLDRDAYNADALKMDMNKLQSLVDFCQAGNMRAIAEHIGSIRGSTVLLKGEVVPVAGAVDKAEADGLMNFSLQLVYKYDPHLDPKQGRTMDPYR